MKSSVIEELTGKKQERTRERNIVLKLEYFGREFEGWQIQARGRTVQGVIKENLEKFLRHEIKLTGAGRTDAGVHALAQYANFRTVSAIRAPEILHKLNQMLPDDVVVLDCRECPPEFDSRRSAIWRQYRYLICEKHSAINRHLSWIIGRRLDKALLDQMAEMVAGGQKFGNFCKTKSLKEDNACDVISSEWRRQGGFLHFEITANRFLHNMVRLLVGCMVAVLEGKVTLEHFEKMVLNKINEKAKYIAPSGGLYLAAVGYGRDLQ
jgi:tRNA pseudouridine38-40 synthase